MVSFRDELSTETRASMRGAGRVSGESRIRIARLNARQRGVQSRLVVVPADSVMADEWDVSDGFGDYALTMTTTQLVHVLSMGQASVVHPSGARWSPDPKTLHVVPADDAERRYLRTFAPAPRTTRSSRGGRRGAGRSAVVAEPVVVQVPNEARESWADNRPGYVSKRERRRRNAAARDSVQG